MVGLINLQVGQQDGQFLIFRAICPERRRI